MPGPSVLRRPIEAQRIFDATITLDPPPTGTRPAVPPQSAWAKLGQQLTGGQQQLVLAEFSSSLPASLEPNGTLRPEFQNVVAWVVYGKGLPFSLETASVLPQPGHRQPGPFPCTFIGQSMVAWNATTGQEIADMGGAPQSGHTLHLQVTPWSARRGSR